MVIQKSFKPESKPAEVRGKKQAVSSKPADQTADATAEEKKAQRLKELLEKYEIVKSDPVQLAVRVRVNMDEELPVEKKEPEVPVQEQKKRR